MSFDASVSVILRRSVSSGLEQLGLQVVDAGDHPAPSGLNLRVTVTSSNQIEEQRNSLDLSEILNRPEIPAELLEAAIFQHLSKSGSGPGLFR